ncbi:hypothetical protein GDO86_011235 [Hymenochirus boettgeri]|uniref:Dystrobrevin binding protein 1 n=1 Tax=Hymenochirus boettgeri TaxID=247094 RepID=A0A8T2JIB4_9PIPI|nr:hypothetical protein GDO86_011235 [Hymenochirus boettgeri]
MFENLRDRLLSVQQDLTSGFKNLGDKSREVKMIKHNRPAEQLAKFPAGAELLSRYEDTWALLHKEATDSAKAGEQVDGEVVMLSAHWEKKKNSLVELQEQLQQVPALLTDLDAVMARLVALDKDFEDIEKCLFELEELCEQCELQRLKHTQNMQLERYKKNKRKELENFKAELDAEHTQKVLDMEHAQQMKLKERQKFFEEAFQQDMEQYLSSGYLQISERREPIGSMSSMEVNVDMLEQMDLMDMSDQEALDVFLNSSTEDNSVLSPMIGSEFDSCHSEITLQVPTQAELRHKLSSLSSTCTDSASQENSEDGGESPVVQSDDEDVHADSVLGNVIKTSSDVSDESDSHTA